MADLKKVGVEPSGRACEKGVRSQRDLAAIIGTRGACSRYGGIYFDLQYEVKKKPWKPTPSIDKFRN
jgi:hypothetical protein